MGHPRSPSGGFFDGVVRGFGFGVFFRRDGDTDGEPDEKDDAGGDGAEAGKLRVGESPEDFGIAADELDEEACEAGKDEVLAEDPSGAVGLCAATPEPPADDESADELVERGGVDALVDGVNAVGKAHAPGKRGGDAVASVAGEEAADASDAVADGGGGGGEIEDAKTADAGAAALNDERGESEGESAEPGEAGLIPEDGPAHFADVGWGVKNVPELCADDAGDDGEGDHSDGIGVEPEAAEVALHDESCSDRGAPEEQAEGGDVEAKDVDIRKHPLLQYRRAGLEALSGRAEQDFQAKKEFSGRREF